MNSPRRYPVNCILMICMASVLWVSQVSRAEKSQTNIPRVEFNDTPLSEAIEFFRTRSLELHQPGERINFVIDPKVDQEQLISLQLNDLPIGAAIIYMIDYAGLDYRIDAHACFILPHGQGDLAKRTPLTPAMTANFRPAKKARQVVLKKIEFAEAPIQSVIEYIVERSEEALPESGGINLVLNQYIDPEMLVSIQMTNTPISGILSAMAELTSLEIRIESHAIFFDPPGTKALQLAVIKTARLGNRKTRPQRPRTGGNPYYTLGGYPNDPRSAVHPDYIDSTYPVISKRTNALDNVYKWVGGKWTFVRKGSADLGESSLDTKNGKGLRVPSLSPPQ